MMSIKIIIGFLSLSLFISCASEAQKKDLPVAEFEKGIEKPNIQILDVRTQDEYKSGHLKNAFLADWTQPEVFSERIQSLDKNKPVYTYCLSGGRSSAATNRLREEGFKEVYNLQGGIMAWKNAQKEVEGIAEATPITLEEYLLKIPTDKTVLVDFGAPWCPPCKKMEPIINEIVREKGNALALVYIDGGIQEKLAATLNASTFPTYIIYKKGKEVWRATGIVSKEILLQQIN